MQPSCTRSQSRLCNPGQKTWITVTRSIVEASKLCCPLDTCSCCVLGRMMHLTNYSVNKQSVAYNPNVPSFIFYSLFSLLQEPSFRSEPGRARRGGPWTRRCCGSAAPCPVSWRSWQDKEDAAVDESGQPRASKWLGPQMFSSHSSMFCWHFRSVKSSGIFILQMMAGIFVISFIRRSLSELRSESERPT